MKEILERRSIRKYTSEPVSDKDLEVLLKCAMAAPSANNQQPWEFIIIKDKNLLNKVVKVDFESYYMLKEAPVAVVICGNLEKEIFKEKGFWVQDCSAATENILIAAQYNNLGAVWLGVYPIEDRVAGLRKLLNLPEKIIPLSIVSLGHSAEKKPPSNRFDKSRIHINIWQ